MSKFTLWLNAAVLCVNTKQEHIPSSTVLPYFIGMICLFLMHRNVNIYNGMIMSFSRRNPLFKTISAVSCLGKSYFMIQTISFQTSPLIRLQTQIQGKDILVWVWEKVSRVTWMKDFKNLFSVIKAVAGPRVLADFYIFAARGFSK